MHVAGAHPVVVAGVHQRGIHDETSHRDPPSGRQGNDTLPRLKIEICIIDYEAVAVLELGLDGGGALLPRAERVPIDDSVARCIRMVGAKVTLSRTGESDQSYDLFNGTDDLD